jgi:hypothetical protein
MFSSPVGKIQPSSLGNPTLCMRRGFFVASETIQTSISSGKRVTDIPSPDHSTNQIAVVRGEIERLRKPQTTTQLSDLKFSFHNIMIKKKLNIQKLKF